ncbi:MAG TPA: transcription termination/antitermination NusG family protein [Terracidiphilus sp.]|nr:transcription termination/antitermination NusG family protein [Terracidiphilus sp.]
MASQSVRAGFGPQEPAFWVAVYTKQHHEKMVAKHLFDQSIDCYLPLYRSKRNWSHCRSAIVQMPLFPNYLFARTSRGARIQILRTPGVIEIVGRHATDERVSDKEIDILRAGLHLRNPQPHEVAVGEAVRITAGPLIGIQGVLTRYKSFLRVVITVPMVRQNISVEISASEIEPVPQGASS